MRFNPLPPGPHTARIFLVLLLVILLACLSLVQAMGGFSSLAFIFHQLFAIPSDVAVLTYHNDNLRTGQYLNETFLNTSNVNAQHFGERVSYPVDGQVYAQPLFVPDVTIKGHHYDVVYIATENDSVYAFDADQVQVVAPLWKTSFLHPPIVTTVSTMDVFGKYPSHDIQPTIGITGTPVIDLRGNDAGIWQQVYAATARARYHDRQRHAREPDDHSRPRKRRRL